MTSKRRKPIGPKRRAKAGAKGAPRLRRAVAGSRDSAEQLRLERDEALEQQAATSEILSVISRSPNDVQPVLDTIVRAAVKLCNAYDAVILLRDGDRLRIVAHHGPIKIDFTHGPINRDWVSGRSVVDRKPVHVRDMTAEGDEFPLGRDISARLKHPTVLGIPFTRGGEVIGCLTLRRNAVLPFAKKQIALLQTFAAQAVIAIENARLLHELRESLQQQTATADVLKTISRSTFDLRLVLDTLTESAVGLCEAEMACIVRPEGEYFIFSSNYRFPQAFVDLVTATPLRAGRGSLAERVLAEGHAVHIPDALADPEYHFGEGQKAAGFRAMLGVPLLRGGMTIGVIILTRSQPRPFTEKQIELVTTFADQAVIAIENARLFEAEQQRTHELTESLEQQTATSDVLRVISSSTGDLAPVFEAMLQNAVRICGAQFGNLLLRNADTFEVGATHGAPTAYVDFVRREAPFRIDPHLGLGQMLKTRQTYQVADIAAVPTHGDKLRVGTIELAGARTVLGVPMLKDDEVVGSIIIYRREVRLFTDKQIELMENFAAQAVIAIENARLLNELRQRTDELSESLEQQTATSEVLRVISSSPGDLEPVFQSMLQNAVRICEAKAGNIYRWEDAGLRLVTSHNATAAFVEVLRQAPLRATANNPVGRMLKTKSLVHIADLAVEQPYIDKSNPVVVAAVDVGEVRTQLSVPLLKEDEFIGAITLWRDHVRPFEDKQVELVQNFAAQAVIAIENTRLLTALRQRTDDLTESLEQQTATSEVLKVISSSPGALEPVFNAMLENATRICEAKVGNLFLFDGNDFRAVAVHGDSDYADWFRRDPMARVREQSGSPLDRLILTKQVIHIRDLREDQSYIDGNRRITSLVETAGARTHLVVPMLKDRDLVGAIVIYRQDVRPFTDKQIALVQNFAAQAVIAIENTRLLSELHQRTDDLTESLEQQTATSEVLNVISRSPTDTQPVFDVIVESAARLCDAVFCMVWLYDGTLQHHAASYNLTPEARAQVAKTYPRPPDHLTTAGRAILAGKIVHIPNIAEDREYAQELAAAGRWHASASVPMLRDGKPIGAISIGKAEPGPFLDRQIQLLTTFADQAVIAIENTRLLSELRESLDQQTATADVLRVISSSTGDLQPVFDAMLANATRLCEASYGTLWLHEGDDRMLAAALYGNLPAEYLKTWGVGTVFRPKPSVPSARAMSSKKPVQLVDLKQDRSYLDGDALAVAAVDLAGIRTIMSVPMIKDDVAVGAMTIYRREVRPFTDKQVELVGNFAAQAVIAIENTRLLTELRESLQQQTATADVLKVISRSAFDLHTVLDTLLQSAARLCDADQGTITQRKGNTFFRTVSYGFSAAFLDFVKDVPVAPGRETGTGRALAEGKVIHIPDVLADPDYTWSDAQKLGGFRTLLGVPMLRDGVSVGVFTLTRSGEVRPFTDKQIELVSTFADQAAIAIENVRLFEAEQQRTQELAKSLEDLRTAQDRLVQTEKLASLGQLTAGIAHEIKNPLNFVNNFSGVSVELIDELQEALARVAADDQTRADIAELSDTLRDNMRKIVQHGKRADSIVKNMLLHSRQGSGERRPTDVNALVEESLNLAYHGARAEKEGFNITLQRSFDPAAGEIELFPQEITRVLLNLIGNGFYAASKRQAGNGEKFEPTLAAATRNLGDSVEISIRDNGTGIPPEVKEKMFNPFFTTKPAGEGTGLGLSLSHDIVVKQHSGSIEVDTEPGAFTEFRIVLPRTAAKPSPQ